MSGVSFKKEMGSTLEWEAPAIVLDTRDTAKARSFVKALAGRAGAQTTSYRGISYQATTSGIAFAWIGVITV